jgi:hypothetical protein
MSNQFAANLNKICVKAKDKAEMVVRKTAIELQKSMILKSPVGNPSLWKSKPPAGYVGGQFRANWQCGIGAINSVKTDPVGSDALGKTTVSLDGWKPGQTIFLTNSLPYSKKLEDGFSTQAPFGMVKLTVNEYGQFLKKAARSIK